MAGTNRPELEMIHRALVPGGLAVPVAYLAGALFADVEAGVSSVIGVVVVLGNFAAHGWSLAWASRISIGFVQGVALAGLVVRMGVIVGLMFLLNATEWFSPLAFGLAVVPGTLLLLVYETRLVLRGLGGELHIPADGTAVRAAERLSATEA